MSNFSLAIRSGDYYMFDEVEDDDIDLLPEEKESFDDFDEGPKPYLFDVSFSFSKLFCTCFIFWRF